MNEGEIDKPLTEQKKRVNRLVPNRNRFHNKVFEKLIAAGKLVDNDPEGFKHYGTLISDYIDDLRNPEIRNLITIAPKEDIEMKEPVKLMLDEIEKHGGTQLAA